MFTLFTDENGKKQSKLSVMKRQGKIKTEKTRDVEIRKTNNLLPSDMVFKLLLSNFLAFRTS